MSDGFEEVDLGDDVRPLHEFSGTDYAPLAHFSERQTREFLKQRPQVPVVNRQTGDLAHESIQDASQNATDLPQDSKGWPVFGDVEGLLFERMDKYKSLLLFNRLGFSPPNLQPRFLNWTRGHARCLWKGVINFIATCLISGVEFIDKLVKNVGALIFLALSQSDAFGGAVSILIVICIVLRVNFDAAPANVRKRIDLSTPSITETTWNLPPFTVILCAILVSLEYSFSAVSKRLRNNELNVSRTFLVAALFYLLSIVYISPRFELTYDVTALNGALCAFMAASVPGTGKHAAATSLTVLGVFNAGGWVMRFFGSTINQNAWWMEYVSYVSLGFAICAETWNVWSLFEVLTVVNLDNVPAIQQFGCNHLVAKLIAALTGWLAAYLNDKPAFVSAAACVALFGFISLFGSVLTCRTLLNKLESGDGTEYGFDDFSLPVINELPDDRAGQSFQNASQNESDLPQVSNRFMVVGDVERLLFQRMDNYGSPLLFNRNIWGSSSPNLQLRFLNWIRGYAMYFWKGVINFIATCIIFGVEFIDKLVKNLGVLVWLALCQSDAYCGAVGIIGVIIFSLRIDYKGLIDGIRSLPSYFSKGGETNTDTTTLANVGDLIDISIQKTKFPVFPSLPFTLIFYAILVSLAHFVVARRRRNDDRGAASMFALAAPLYLLSVLCVSTWSFLTYYVIAVNGALCAFMAASVPGTAKGAVATSLTALGFFIAGGLVMELFGNMITQDDIGKMKIASYVFLGTGICAEGWSAWKVIEMSRLVDVYNVSTIQQFACVHLAMKLVAASASYMVAVLNATTLGTSEAALLAFFGFISFFAAVLRCRFLLNKILLGGGSQHGMGAHEPAPGSEGPHRSPRIPTTQPDPSETRTAQSSALDSSSVGLGLPGNIDGGPRSRRSSPSSR